VATVARILERSRSIAGAVRSSPPATAQRHGHPSQPAAPSNHAAPDAAWFCASRQSRLEAGRRGSDDINPLGCGGRLRWPRTRATSTLLAVVRANGGVDGRIGWRGRLPASITGTFSLCGTSLASSPWRTRTVSNVATFTVQ